MRALNGAYNAYNIRFSLANLTWTINDAWDGPLALPRDETGAAPGAPTRP